MGVFDDIFKNSPKQPPVVPVEGMPENVVAVVAPQPDGSVEVAVVPVAPEKAPEAAKEPPAAEPAPPTPPAPKKPAKKEPKKPTAKKTAETKTTKEGVVADAATGEVITEPPTPPAPADVEVAIDPAAPGGDKTTVQNVAMVGGKVIGKFEPKMEDGVLVEISLIPNALGKALMRQWESAVAGREGDDEAIAAAIDTFYENDSQRKKQRLQAAVESLAYLKGADQAQIDLFTDKVQLFMDSISDLLVINDIVPEDCKRPMEECAKLLNWYAKAESAEREYPHTLIEKRKEMVIWKGSLGSKIARYRPLTMSHELGYYSMRGALHVALREVGRTLEENIRKGTTVSDTQELAQTMTLGIQKQRVYMEFVVEALVQRQRALGDCIDQIDQELIELRYQRRTEGMQTNPANPPQQGDRY